MSTFKIRADVTITYEYTLEADTIGAAIGDLEDEVFDSIDCIEHGSTSPRATEYTIDGQMGWNKVTGQEE